MEASERPHRRSWSITVRRARADDKEAVLSFATRTWDGSDYIPDVWERWLAATDGVLLVATAGGAASTAVGGRRPVDADGAPLEAARAVAVARLTMLSRDEAWLEGIRVDPRVRGMGVATDFQVAELRWAAAHGVRVVRYATGPDNEGSHRLGARHGFALLGEWRWYGVDDEDEETPPPDAAPSTGGVTIVREVDGDRWWERVTADPTLRRGHDLYERRAWALQELTEERFRGHVARGQVTALEYRADGADRWALAIARDEGWGDEDPALPASPALLVGDGRAALALLQALSGGQPGVPRVLLPDVEPPILDGGTVSAWAAAGWRPRDRTLHILTRPLDAAHPLPEPEDAALLEMEEDPRAVARHWSAPS
ncbi:MAG: GNAT family N-acetyltransferase [Chloroflexi bacterium]|nr:GNAT family N-acetyltransferase [Chloroflexota bacterium]